MKYTSKYKDPRWQRKRLEVMQRDEFCCLHCGNDKATLNVHHSYYVAGRDPWEYENDTLQTLCERCHEYATYRKGRYNPEAGAPDGWLECELEAAARIASELGFHEQVRVRLYSELLYSPAVRSGEVPVGMACDVFSKVFQYALSLDLIERINQEAEAARKAAEGGVE